MFSSSEQMYLEKKKLKVLTELLEGGDNSFRDISVFSNGSQTEQNKSAEKFIFIPLSSALWPVTYFEIFVLRAQACFN